MAGKFTDLKGRTNAGDPVDFSIFEGRVVLCVNVARF